MSQINKEFDNFSKEKDIDQDFNPVLATKGKNYFSTRQIAAQLEGRKKRNALLRATEEAAQRATGIGLVDEGDKIDTILSGSTGIGKTFRCQLALERMGLIKDKDYVLLTGNHSMAGFAIKLMMAHRHFMVSRECEDKKLIVMVDDCDTFFADKDSRNILKALMGKVGTRQFQYTKMFPLHMLDDRQLATMEHYKNNDGSPGFKINCDDVAFIFTTNFIFPTENQAKAIMDKLGPTNRSNSMMDLAALRSRAKTKDFMLEKSVNWGWLVEVSMNDGLLDMLNVLPDPDFSKWRLLDWVLNKWDLMTEHNLRTIADMGRMMIRYPDNFIDEWEADFISEDAAIL